MTRPGRPVVVVGDVGMDVVARPGGPITHGSDTPAQVTMRPAGAGANTAAALAAYGLEVTLLARVGDDLAARECRARLEDAGVRCVWSTDRELPTGMVVVLVDPTGERTMLPGRGANGALRADDVRGAIEVLDAFGAGMPHLHLSGYVLLDPGSRPAGLEALAQARARGWSTSVDPQAAALIGAVGAEVFLDWVHGVDLLLPNADEARALGGRAAMLAAVAPGGGVAVTDGVRGAHWWGPDGADVVVPAEQVDATDTTGAGDAFDAGFLAAWLRGAGAAEALAAGVVAGSAAVEIAVADHDHGG